MYSIRKELKHLAHSINETDRKIEALKMDVYFLERFAQAVCIPLVGTGCIMVEMLVKDLNF